MTAPLHILIVAGGSGKRMNAALPKQYLPIERIPIIAITINRFLEVFPNAALTVIIAERDMEHWQKCREFIVSRNPINVAFGGPERFHSVKSGLAFIKKDEIVAIHDAVRPLFKNNVILQGFQVAVNSGSAIPVIPLTESLREIDGALSRPVDRSRFRVCQTPQFFKESVILDAYRQSYKQSFTDDASVVQAAGHTIRLIDGNSENIKITTPADLLYAEALLKTLT